VTMLLCRLNTDVAARTMSEPCRAWLTTIQPKNSD
jgi:hypothetical protein